MKIQIKPIRTAQPTAKDAEVRRRKDQYTFSLCEPLRPLRREFAIRVPQCEISDCIRLFAAYFKSM